MIKEDLIKAYKNTNSSCKILISGLHTSCNEPNKQNDNCRNCGANSYKNNKCLYCGAK